jgi:outer membrane protein assembly factor BamA
VNLIGNEQVSEKTLKALLNLQEPTLVSHSTFDRRVLRLDAITLKNYYLSQGFLEVSVTDSFQVQDEAIAVYYHIREGKRYYLHRADIVGNQTLSEKLIQETLGLIVDKPFNPVVAHSNLTLLEEAYQQKGKLFVELKLYQEVGDSVNVLLKVTEGPDVYIHDIYFEGLGSLDSAVVLRELQVHPGDLYRKKAVDDSQRRLLETGLFSMASLTPVVDAGSDTTVNLVLELRQFKKREWLSEGGYYPVVVSEGAEAIPGVGGYVEWRNRSILQSTTRFTVRTSADMPVEPGFRFPRLRVDLNLNDQWIFRYRIPTQVRGFYETFKNYEDLGGPNVHRYGVNVTSTIRFGDLSFIAWGLQWEKFIEPEALRTDVEQRILTLRMHLDGRDDPVYPRKGLVLSGELRRVGGFLGGNRHYVKFDLGLQGYHPLLGSWVLAGRLKYGVIFGWRTAYDRFETVLYDKFYLGGSTSLRAWEPLKFLTSEQHDPQGETVRFLTNWELRFPLFWLLGGELFLDGGYLVDAIPQGSWQKVVWGAGGGLTLKSPLGPVRLDYAYQLERPQNWQLQLGILYIF